MYLRVVSGKFLAYLSYFPKSDQIIKHCIPFGSTSCFVYDLFRKPLQIDSFVLEAPKQEFFPQIAYKMMAIIMDLKKKNFTQCNARESLKVED